jgi:hypothetical protein
MKPDDVIALRAEWAYMSYGKDLPEATVLATPDWVTYVRAMSDALLAQSEHEIVQPLEEDVLWGWPDGVAIIFPEPFPLQHTIISKAQPDGSVETVDPHYEEALSRALWVLPTELVPSTSPVGEHPCRPIFWIGEDPLDIVSGWWVPGVVTKSTHERAISESTRLTVSILSALGHRLTRLDEVAATRPERRRIGRAMSGPFRVLQLANRASGRSDEAPGKVDWQKRWFVHGHWRMQPCGPNRSQRRPIWIDTFIKGPEDKPLDDRPTLWKTPHPEG